MGITSWISIGISGVAALVSGAALMVSAAANRAAGPRVSILSSKMSGRGTDLWLTVKISNSGRSEIDVDGAWAGWLGQTNTEMPIRLLGGSSKTLVFISSALDIGSIDASFSIQIDLGNGQTILKRLTLNEREIAYEMGRIAAIREQYKENVAHGSEITPGEPTNLTLKIEEV